MEHLLNNSKELRDEVPTRCADRMRKRSQHRKIDSFDHHNYSSKHDDQNHTATFQGSRRAAIIS